MKPKMTTIPVSFEMFALSRRETICITTAVLIHGLLFLWKGMPLQFLDEAKKDLGEAIVEVTFSSELPTLDQQGPKRAAIRKQGLASKIKSFFKKKKKNTSMLASRRQQSKINVKKPGFTKVENKLQSKEFNKQNAFNNLKNKSDMAIAKGSEKDLTFQKLAPQAKSDSPSLKSKNYRLASKDSPFKIFKAKKNDALSMNSSVPVNVGRRTTREVKALNDKSDGPSLTSKNFKSAKGSRGGFGSKGGKSGTGGLLATGASSKIGGSSPVLASANTGSSGATGGSLSGRSGGYARSGQSLGSTGFSQNSGAGAPSAGLGKGNEPSLGGDGDGRFSISGALRNRKPVTKVFPKARMDARVALKFRVDWLGRVLDGIVVTISSGSPSFDREVLNSLKKWVFSKLAAAKSNVIQEGIITFIFRGV